jgi:hypothetical protein
VLAAALAVFYAFLGATALGPAGAAGIVGGLVALSLVLVRDLVPRSFAIPALAVALLPFAAATWWSVATPVIAALLVALGTAALGAERGFDHPRWRVGASVAIRQTPGRPRENDGRVRSRVEQMVIRPR